MTLAPVHEHLQRESLDVLRPLLEPGMPVALVDFPLHDNAGDSLIYLGERAYLRRLGIPVRYQTSVGRYRPADLAGLHPEGPILLHGGGNFGDRWALFQHFRERVIADFPDRRIVQLPQSVEMSPGTAARVRSAYLPHPDLTVLLRDTHSLRRAADLLEGVRVDYCPDLAFGYRPTRTRRARVDIVQLRRADSESTGMPLVAGGGSWSQETVDWNYSPLEKLTWNLAKAPGSVAKRAPRALPRFSRALVDPGYALAARTLVRAAEDTLLRGRVVVTDRLHAAVLATLLGRPVVARDNANGKLASVFADYLGRFPLVRFAHTAEEADDHVRELLQPPR
ncbi:polysaccharide pyruvyl transferase family protein [Microbacterium sp. ProA8]|uniref:polysaccharide pyruvyl transferase family protein n=1 Tax=Microbacterium chionoecetis TaxID=3153754 RepID=UPI003264DA0E